MYMYNDTKPDQTLDHALSSGHIVPSCLGRVYDCCDQSFPKAYHSFPDFSHDHRTSQGTFWFLFLFASIDFSRILDSLLKKQISQILCNIYYAQ